MKIYELEPLLETPNLGCIYIADKETCTNISTLLKKNDTEEISIPIRYRDKYLSRLLNLTYNIKALTNKKILKIKPLRPIFLRVKNTVKISAGVNNTVNIEDTVNIGDGLSIVTDEGDKIYNRNISLFGEYSFGEKREPILKDGQTNFKISFDPKYAAQQLKQNLLLLSLDTGITKNNDDDDIWIIGRVDKPDKTILLFAKLSTKPNSYSSFEYNGKTWYKNDITGELLTIYPKGAVITKIEPPKESVITKTQLVPTIKKEKALPKRVKSSSVENSVPIIDISELELKSKSNFVKSKSFQSISSSDKTSDEKKYYRTYYQLNNIIIHLNKKFINKENTNRNYNELNIILNLDENVKNRGDLISILKNIVKNNNKEDKVQRESINNIIKKLEIEEKKEEEEDFSGGYKKYYHKYLKYKQKYLEAKKLHSDELHDNELHDDELKGGMNGDRIFIFCSEDVKNVLLKIYPTKIKSEDKEFFFFLTGPNSFYTEGKSTKICRTWYKCFDNMFWEGGLGIIKGRFIDTLDLKEAIKQINEKKLLTQPFVIEEKHENGENVKINVLINTYFSFKSVSGGYELNYTNLPNN